MHVSQSYLSLSISFTAFLSLKWWLNRNQLTISMVWGEKKIQIHFAILAIITGIVIAVGWTSLSNLNLIPKYPSYLMFASAIIGTGFLFPLVEEIFFRGLLYETLRAHCHLINAIMVSAIIFAVAHYDYWFEPFSLFVAFIIGLIAALFAEYTNSLTMPFILHLIINLLQQLHFQFR